jgi:exopolysaccharide production protein ExoQ
MNAIRRFLVLLVLGSCAFILSKGLLVMFLLPDPPPYGGNSTTRLILTVSYLSVAMILVSSFREALFVVRRNWLLTALVLLALASCLWAESPAFVLQRSVAVLGTTLLGLALATRLSLEEQLRLMSWVFRIMAVLSLACVLFLPSYGISQSVDSQGEWQGIFGYKNTLGAMMALSLLVEWHRPADTSFSKFVKWLALLLSAVLLVFSNSVTPLVALVASLSLVEIYKFANQRHRIPLYAILLAILLIIGSGLTLVLMDNESVAGVLGRSSNLTGRTQIWSLVLSKISERPVLGYGYSGFWYGSSSESFAVDQAFGFGTSIMYSHNGYLETFLNLGVVGFFLVLAFLGVGMTRAYYCSRRDRSSANLWPLAFLSFFLLYNLGECTILLQDLQWALCVSVVASADAALFIPNAKQEVEELPYVPIIEMT